MTNIDIQNTPNPRRQCMRLMFLAAIMLLAVGCASQKTITTRYPDRIPPGKEFEADRNPIEFEKSFEAEVPGDSLTLEHALALALLHNPDLNAQSWTISAKEALALQASLLPNPELAVEIENIAGSGNFSGLNQSETTLQLSQLVELGGKRAKRTRVSALESDLAAWDYEIIRLDVLAQVTLAFTDLISAQERRALNQELVNLAQEFVAMVLRRVEAGATSPAEASRARVALSNAQIELERSEREITAARRRLAATWGSQDPFFQEAIGSLTADVDIPEVGDLLRLVSQNPEVARWAVEMEYRRALLSLEQAGGIPDPRISGGVRRVNETDDNAFVAGISLPLPIFSRNQGSTAAAGAQINQAEWSQRATQVRTIALLTQFYEALLTAFNEVKKLQNEVLPEAQNAFDTITAGYNLGKFGFLDVLDAQRTLFNSRAQYLRASTEYNRLKAEVERLIGQSLDSIQ